jgi:class 3 adenylate cyclase
MDLRRHSPAYRNLPDRHQLAHRPPDRWRPTAARMLLRIGVHLGDVIAEGEDVFGDGVNVATRNASSTNSTPGLTNL